MPLNLQTYTINRIDEKEHDIIFHLSTIEKPTICINCHEKSLRKYRKRTQFYFDIPSRGKRVGLQIEIQSYLCKECSKSFQEPLRDISKSHNMTNRLVDYVELKSLQRPFTHLANEIGCVEGTIRKIFKNHVSELQNKYKFETIRAKMLYTKSIHKTQKPKIDKSFNKISNGKGIFKYSISKPIKIKKLKNYGVDLVKLSKSIQNDTFKFET